MNDKIDRGFFTKIRTKTSVGIYATVLFTISVLTVQVLIAIALDEIIFGPAIPGVQTSLYEVAFSLSTILTIMTNTAYCGNWFLSKALR